MWRRFVAALLAAMLVLSGCATDSRGNRRPLTDAEKGALIGAAVGAAVGMTHRSHRKRSVIIGAVGGAIAGGLVGSYMDRQKQDLEKVLRPELDRGAIRIEKLPGHRLRISMTGATAFDVDSTAIKPGFHSTLDKMARVLNRYGKTELVIVGHTDSTGPAAYNQRLSERRARAVMAYLLQRGVIPERLSAYGKGETQPVASNATEAGRRRNRRVEIEVIPLVEGEPG